MGTSVTIVIPGVEGLADGSARTTPRQPIQVGTGRVLLVEDEQPLLDFVTAQAKDLGYTVEAVADGHAALDLLNSEKRFDLLFTDVVLPKGISGIELAKQGKVINPDLRVLLTSGYPEEVFQHQERMEEGTLLLRKPYRRKELADTLRRAMAGGRNPASSRSFVS